LLDDEHAVLVVDLAARLARQSPLVRVDLTRYQRASEGPGQSAGRGCDEEVKRRCALDVAPARDPVVVGDLVMDAELDRLLTRRQPGAAERPSHALDPDVRDVRWAGHGPDCIALRWPEIEEEP
jgi:hypothetical protein